MGKSLDVYQIQESWFTSSMKLPRQLTHFQAPSHADASHPAVPISLVAPPRPAAQHHCFAYNMLYGYFGSPIPAPDTPALSHFNLPRRTRNCAHIAEECPFILLARREISVDSQWRVHLKSGKRGDNHNTPTFFALRRRRICRSRLSSPSRGLPARRFTSRACLRIPSPFSHSSDTATINDDILHLNTAPTAELLPPPVLHIDSAMWKLNGPSGAGRVLQAVHADNAAKTSSDKATLIARRLLKSLSNKQGIEYDSPESAQDTPGFIAFYGLQVDEICNPLDSFKTFNRFFYRYETQALRAPRREARRPFLSGAADCHFMACESVYEATRLWIQGREFTVARLLGDAYKHEAERYTDGALAIFRLAPQDYHRFHSPLGGEREARAGVWRYADKDVLVGGSTIVLLFEKDMVEWDEDLLVNGRASLETLVRVGMGIGAAKKKSGDKELITFKSRIRARRSVTRS
ncbi:hypothetical protein R3P38DRAFT_2814152 [Favolaschia claudopus]|uniref:Phosphatidylserine decarboxylase n=1 Tax=Favolaschia claudopus TaxID=2862362 RepID=A0AAV9Z3N5_9AGAR